MSDAATDLDLNPFSPEAMAQAGRWVSTDAERAAAAGPVHELGDQGYAVLSNLIEGDTLAAARAALDTLNDQTPPSTSTFGGFRTRRPFNLLGQSRAFDPLVTHPLVIAAIEAHLDDQIQISEASGITIGPGEPAQILHHDDGCYPLSRPHPPLMVSVMWALDDFEEANGGTRMAPGTHQVDQPVIDELETIPMEMTAGSALLWDGRTIHGGGANHAERPRRGVAVLYAKAWLRQQENQFLCLDRTVVAGFDRRYQRLLGWCIYANHTGLVGGRDPKHLLNQTVSS